MDIAERFKELRKAKKMTQEKFADAIGISRSSLSQIEGGRILPSLDALKNAVNKLGVSYEYLFEDEPGQISVTQESLVPYTRRTDRKVQDQQVPLFNIEATAGLVPLFQNSADQTPTDYLSIPHLPKCDGAVFVTGDSMYPLLKSGDIVCYKQITDKRNDIFYGEMYLISISMAGEEYISVKYIQKSDLGAEYVKLVSQNQHHQTKDVNIDSIVALAHINATIKSP